MDSFRPRWLVLAPLLACLHAAPVLATEPADTLAPSRPRRVLLVRSFGESAEPFRTAAATFRTQLALESPDPIEFFDVSLETARYDDDAADAPFVAYIHALFKSRPPDLVVPVGSPAALFCARQRSTLFPDAPLLVYASDQRRLAGIDTGPNSTVLGVQLDIHGFMADILALFPETKRVYVVLGASPLERYWVEETRREWQPFAGQIAFTWLGGLTMREIEDELKALPDRSVVVFALMNVDAAGVPYEQKVAIDRIHHVANAPVFGFFSLDLGSGALGGRMVDMEALAVEGAQTAVRLLDGEPASAIAPRFIGPGSPRFDARELRRWNVDERRLPPQSVVLFREPTLWEAYRTHIIAVGIFVLLQALTIVFLLAHRSRLRAAQRELEASNVRLNEVARAQDEAILEAQSLRRQLAHSGRLSLLGQLMASVSHELGQPLGAIMRNADAAELFLKSESPDLEEIRAIVADIRRDDERASSVIKRMRSLLSRRQVQMQPQDLSQVVAEVMTIIRADAESRHVELDVDVPRELAPVRGDRIHLQQVMINLLVNAMDALDGDPERRRVRVAAHRLPDGMVQVTVSDRGHGIAAGSLDGIFDPFVSTKPEGMGMGLPISKSIVEAHGGRIWAENDPEGGAAFHFTLPVANGAR